MNRLITPSLIGSISWLKTCPTSWKTKAVKDLKNQLARVWSTPSEACLLGIKFEDAVVNATINAPDKVKGSDHFKWIVEEIRNGEFQRRTTANINIDGQDYCLYGRIDAYFPEIIKDIKTTSNYKGAEHYLSSFQHKMYCYNENIRYFRYVIAEFDSSQTIIAHHAIDVDLPNRLSLEAEIVDKIKEAMAFLTASTEFLDLYTTTFCKH